MPIHNCPNKIFINIDKGKKWQEQALSEDDLSTYDIISTDLNNDGYPDIVEANSGAQNKYYFNLGPKPIE